MLGFGLVNIRQGSMAVPPSTSTYERGAIETIYLTIGTVVGWVEGGADPGAHPLVPRPKPNITAGNYCQKC